MTLTVKPVSVLKGKINLPASKSYSIRAFLISSCGGNSNIIASSNCDDANVSRQAAKQLGAKISTLKNNSWKVEAGKTALKKFLKINVKESGTVLRFLLPMISSRAHKAVILGEGTLKGRPNLFLIQALREMGLKIRGTGKGESIPIYIEGGALSGGNIDIDGTLSSQFISALLIICPLLNENTRLKLIGKDLVSTDYITMTLQVLHKAGIKISFPAIGGKIPNGKGEAVREYLIQGRQKYKGLKNFHVPSDYGLAAFFMAAAALIKSDITLKGHLKDELIQADARVLYLLDKMGVKYSKTSKSIKMKGPFELKGGDFSLKDCPDLVPIMSILALFAKGKTRLYGIKHARVKESDRISDLRKELLKVGARIIEKDSELSIYPIEHYKQNRVLDPHNDHRLAMAFCVLGLKLGIRVIGIECAHKSYPDYVKDIRSIGARV